MVAAMYWRVLPLCSLALACGLSLGCETLTSYSGEYAGEIIDGNFVRRCFPSGTTASLRFDPEDAVAAVEVPEQLNTLTTSDGSFDDTPLVPFTALPHDQLSKFDFPGPARVQNYLLLAHPSSGALAGRDATVVVSILDKGSIEVRVMARTELSAPRCPVAGVDDDVTAVGDGHEYFGVFQLQE